MIHFCTWYNDDFPIVVEQIAETLLSFGHGKLFVHGLPMYKNCGTGIYSAVHCPTHLQSIALDECGDDLENFKYRPDTDYLVYVGHDEFGLKDNANNVPKYHVQTPVKHHLWSPVATALFLNKINTR